ncbi:shikimate dehydrogenase [Isosphaeraceae bacterium EP7]
MICAIIGRGRHSSVLEEWEAAANAGAGLVELRLDCLRREADLKRLLAKRHTPVIVTVRRAADGGLWRGDEEKRQKLIREAIVMGVDYIDLESDIAGQIPRFGKTKRIVSYHNMRKTPEDLGELYGRCAEANADIVKIATLAASIVDGLRLLELASETALPTIAIGMGEVGFFTRILGPKFGAPFTYAGFNPDRVFAPGLPTLKELQRTYQFDKIDRESEIYAVIGDPVRQSLSPAVHNAAFRALGLNKVYVPIQVPAGRVKETLGQLTSLRLKGLSVTIPHKEAIVPCLNKVDGAVGRIGSCNTVVMHDDGRVMGHNTDYRAAMDSLEEAVHGQAVQDKAGSLVGRQALILGAGGVARAIAYGLNRRGAGVTLTNRTDERAIALAEEVGCRTIPWGMRASTLADILVNCTPVGMHPDVDDTPMPPAGFRSGSIVFDTIYHPENTMFLKLAKERGCTTISGVDMFIRQAALQFHLFTGQEAPMDLMRDVVRRKLGPLQS